MIIMPNDKIEKYLDELSNEYRELLYRELILNSNPLDELSVSELLRLDNEIKRPFLESYKRILKLKRMFLVMGMAYIFAGFIFSLLSFLIEVLEHGFQYRGEDILVLMSQFMIFIGIIVIIYANNVSKMRKPAGRAYKGVHKLLEYEIIIAWRELEGVVNDISIDVVPNTNRSIIEFLSKNHFINSADFNKLKKLLRIRNSIVHFENTYTDNEMKNAVADANKIIIKLKKIV